VLGVRKTKNPIPLNINTNSFKKLNIFVIVDLKGHLII